MLLPAMAHPEQHRTIAQHRKARYLYEVLEELECGLVLQGTEVKSLRDGQASIAESYAAVRDGELWLVGCTIPVYSHGSIHNHDTARERKLLATKKQIQEIIEAFGASGDKLKLLACQDGKNSMAKLQNIGNGQI